MSESELDAAVPYDEDATVVRPARAVAEAPEADAVSEYDDVPYDDDLTVVRPRPIETPAADNDDDDDDLTVVRPHLTAGPVSARADFRGDPVPEPELGPGSLAQFAPPAGETVAAGAGAGGDPEQPQDTSGALRRAANFMPRVYGPRPVAAGHTPATEAPAEGGVAALNSRAQLPSVARRDRRARVFTLAGYAAAVCVTGVGLWFVATLAFAG